VRIVYEQMAREFAVVPALTIFSPVPDLLASIWCLSREALIVDRANRPRREALATAVSRVDKCPYCVDIHHSMLHATADHELAEALATTADADTFARSHPLVAWGLATAHPGAAIVACPPFSGEEAAQFLGTAVTFHFINRMVNLFLEPSPLPFGSTPMKPLIARLLGATLGKRLLRVEAEAGRSLARRHPIPRGPPSVRASPSGRAMIRGWVSVGLVKRSARSGPKGSASPRNWLCSPPLRPPASTTACSRAFAATIPIRNNWWLSPRGAVSRPCAACPRGSPCLRQRSAATVQPAKRIVTMPALQPSSLLFLGFLTVLALLVSMALARYLRPGHAAGAIAGLSLWLTYGGLVGYFGIVADPGLVPPGPAFLLIPVILFVALFLARSAFAGRLAAMLPLGLLIGAQGFRVVVELFLYQLWQAGLAPRMLTFEGGSIDIFLGLSAPIVAWLYGRGRLGERVLLGWNIIGLLTLANVAIRALLTAPGALNFIVAEVPNLAIGTFPFTFIPGFMAPLALVLHVLSIRALRAKPAGDGMPAAQPTSP
jgi:AhpD family alkylhydroperoxidase